MTDDEAPVQPITDGEATAFAKIAREEGVDSLRRPLLGETDMSRATQRVIFACDDLTRAILFTRGQNDPALLRRFMAFLASEARK